MDSAKSQKVEAEINNLLHPKNTVSKSVPYKWPRVRDVDELKPGDHLCYYKFPYWKHGIIIKIKNGGIVKHLRYHLLRGEIDVEDILFSKGKVFVLNKDSQSRINLLKAIYSGDCLDSDTAVERALCRRGEKLYHPVTNFARAFPRWCKTGKGGLTAVNEVRLYHNREVIKLIEYLARGDHIAFDRGSYFHHAIVLSTNPQENTIEVIHFTIGECESDEEKENAKEKKIEKRKCQIKKATITRHEETGTLYRLNYREHSESEVDIVVLRAELISNEKYRNYNVLNDNCEHLATWCKTGIWQSGQVQALIEHVMILGLAFGIHLGLQVVVNILRKGVKSLVHLFAKIARLFAGKPVDIISCIVLCILDIVYNIYDIRTKYQKGELRGDALREEIIKRALRFLVVNGSVVAGTIVGQAVFPIPILGGLLGGLCGLALGKLITFLILKVVALFKTEQAKSLWEKIRKLVDGNQNVVECKPM